MLTAPVVPEVGKVVNMMPIFRDSAWSQSENGQLHRKKKTNNLWRVTEPQKPHPDRNLDLKMFEGWNRI